MSRQGDGDVAARFAMRIRPRFPQDQDSLPPHSVSMIFRNRVEKAGAQDRCSRANFIGLRAGFVLEAYMAGARDEEIMSHTGHRDLATT